LTVNRFNKAGSYIDRITTQYTGNKINLITDLAGDIPNVTDYPGSTSQVGGFIYDQNGNLIQETNKLIYIDYNLFNLPKEINYWAGYNRRINYYYNFDGAKLRKRVENNGTLTKVDYCGPFVYETASGVRSLKYLVTPYGRAVKNGSSWIYEYNLIDHLGNVRVVIRKGANNLAEVVQERHYYPFGMEMSELSYNFGSSTPNKYLYNGKELENDYGIYLYDYGARFYDPQLGRWHSVDPLAEDFPSWTPYHYCHNNPIVLIDPDGRLADWYQSESGTLLWKDENKQQITVNGEKFNNVGTSASIGTGDGNYINYYQNVPVSISNAPVNAQKTVLNNDGLKGQLLSRQSPLSQKSQTRLMNSGIHKSQNEFLSNALEITVSSIEMSGDIISFAGYSATATGLGAPLGLGMVTLGGSISMVGGLAQSGIYAMRGNNNAAIYKASTSLFSAGSARWIGNQNFSQTEKLLGVMWTDIFRKPVDYTVGSVLKNK